MKNSRKAKYTAAQKKVRRLLIWSTATILVAGLAIFTLLEAIISAVGIIDKSNQDANLIISSIILIITSTIIGTALSILTNKMFFLPIYKILGGMERLSKGNLSTRINLSRHRGLSDFEKAFNNMAEELSKVEILRSDFINNFSHEFKTPIASIQGLVGIMKTKDLSPEKKMEYLTIIEEETKRLSLMTTNVLSITRLENQKEISRTESFNLSEQIRFSILMFEKIWTEKKVNLSLDFDDYTVAGDEDLMKQIWINLLDNAFKFVNEGGDVNVSITKKDSLLRVDISNTGKTIPPDHLDKIFNKFHQVDRKEAKNGNGIGLSIVKRIVELHKGKVLAKSSDGVTVISVILPC